MNGGRSFTRKSTILRVETAECGLPLLFLGSGLNIIHQFLILWCSSIIGTRLLLRSIGLTSSLDGIDHELCEILLCLRDSIRRFSSITGGYTISPYLFFSLGSLRPVHFFPILSVNGFVINEGL